MIYIIANEKIRMKIKAKERKYLIFIPSGKFQGWDKNTEDSMLFDSISRLLKKDFEIILLPFIQKLDDKNSDDTFIQNQYDILRFFLLNNISIFSSCSSVSFVSVSIGSHVLLKFLSDESLTAIKPNKCILVSLVLEGKIDIYSNVEKILLLYGSNDWVGYFDSENSLEICSPEIYSKNTSNLISTVNSQKKEVIILSNHGHFLENSNNHDFDESSQIIFQNLIS